MAPPSLLPKIVAFDLDATLWYPEMYMLSGPPFKLRNGAVVDRRGEETRLMGDSLKILQTLATDEQWAETQVAYVSRTDRPDWAATHLRMFEVVDGLDMHSLAVHHEIYVGSKLHHFKRIQERTKIEYRDMLFFDNENWNIKEVSQLGVVSVYTPNGMTWSAFETGLREFQERKKKAAARRPA